MLFADEYMRTGVATQAAIAAGYEPKYAGVNADKLKKNPKVAEYMEKRNKELSSPRIASIQEIREFWTTLFRNEKARTVDRLKASEDLARSYGAFLEKVEVKQEHANPFVELTKEQLLKLAGVENEQRID